MHKPWLRCNENTAARARRIRVIECRVRCLRPLRFDDVVDAHVELGAARRASFAVGYLLTRDGAPCCTAVTQHASGEDRGRLARLPAWRRELADAHPHRSVVRPAP